MVLDKLLKEEAWLKDSVYKRWLKSSVRNWYSHALFTKVIFIYIPGVPSAHIGFGNSQFCSLFARVPEEHSYELPGYFSLKVLYVFPWVIIYDIIE